jgi:hypothetical protein
LREQPRAVFVIYHNAALEHAVTKNECLQKIGGTHQYSIYRR